MTKKTLKRFCIILIILSLFIANIPAAIWAENQWTFGEKAFQHVGYLSRTIGARIANTDKEVEAKDYIAAEFQRMGYQTMVQSFTYQSNRNSNNVIAVKPGLTAKQIIVGAHYDSVSSSQRPSNVIKDEEGNILYPDLVSTGACDNASGVGVMLEVAELLKDIDTTYTIRFIAFGAEEAGLRGSRHYANQMTQEEIDNTVAMINLDTLISGDYMYVYSGLDENTWVREQALALAEKLELNVGTNPGLNPAYPMGTAGDWSDHAPFRQLGIPVGYFEATNWLIGDLDGYEQTEKYGAIIHTWKDNLDFIMGEFPGRVEERLYTFSCLLYHMLLELTPPAQVSSIDLEVAPGIVEVGEDATASIIAKDAANLAGIDLSISFNNGLMDLKEVIVNENFEFCDYSVKDGNIRILGTMLGNAQGLSGDIELVKLIFTAGDTDDVSFVSLNEGSQIADTAAGLYTMADTVSKDLPIADSDITGGGTAVNDLVMVAKAFGKSEGEEGYDPALDMNKDGVIDIIDIAYVASRILLK